MTIMLSQDRLAALLLCTPLGLPKDGGGVKPLSAAQWSTLLVKLAASVWRQPDDLIGRAAAEIARTVGVKPESAERIARLLDRGAQAAIEIQRLADRGISVLTRMDEGYPPRLTQRLAELAPPVLFVAGTADLLAAPGIAVVGSRDIDEAGAAFAREIGGRCGAEGLSLISGAARGVDREAMGSCLGAGGAAVGVLAESLEQTIREPEIARQIRDERLTLITPYLPSVGFSVGNAMGRNKHIYALAELAIVAASAAESGGTWAGAVENLKHDWVPLFVRSAPEAPPGNQALIEAGGLSLTPDDLAAAGELLPGLLARTAPVRTAPPPVPAAEPDTATLSHGSDLFEVVWPRIELFLAEPRTVGEVEACFVLTDKQAKAWLSRAVDEGRAECVPTRTRRYQRTRARLL